MKAKDKKTQSEILGLAMVVILITFGLLLFVMFGLRGDDEHISVEYSYKQLPVLLNNAILETHTSEADCYGEKIQKLLIKAGEGNTLVCKNGQDVKSFVRIKIKELLDLTLGEWNIDYRYTVYKGTDYKDENNYVFNITNSPNNCYGQDIDTENFFFRMSNGQFLNIKLDLCS
jgi:hypothetical protein